MKQKNLNSKLTKTRISINEKSQKFLKIRLICGDFKLKINKYRRWEETQEKKYRKIRCKNLYQMNQMSTQKNY